MSDWAEIAAFAALTLAIAGWGWLAHESRKLDQVQADLERMHRNSLILLQSTTKILRDHEEQLDEFRSLIDGAVEKSDRRHTLPPVLRSGGERRPEVRNIERNSDG